MVNTNAAVSAKRDNQAELTLNDYGNTVAAQLPAATRLLIRIDDYEFQLLLANHQQQAAVDVALPLSISVNWLIIWPSKIT